MSRNQEIARQRKELEALAAGNKFRTRNSKIATAPFATISTKRNYRPDREQTIALYRDGLAICPDDDVAHYELGRTLADAGRRTEAEGEYEAALKINPDFADARRQLEAVRSNR